MLATSIKKKEQEWFREGHKQGRQEGRQEGWQEGTHEAMVQIARNLKAKNIDITVIIEATGLNRKQIEAL
jgi:predicted transposase/invertase (TIGR01784 family)